MAESIYTYVNRFPDFRNKIISLAENPKSDGTYKKCESFKNIQLKYYKVTDESFPNTCAKFSKNINEIINEPEYPKPAFCKYINYWFYEQLKSNPSFPYSSLLNKFYDTIENLDVCKLYNKEITKSKYEELKKLYDLYEPFIKFKTETSEDQSQSCDKIKQCVNLYESYSDNCKENCYNGFCWNLIKFREEYENHRSKETRCVNDLKYLKPIKSDLEAIILMPFVVMILISFILIFLYKFTSFGSWFRPRLPGGKNNAKKLHRRMQELQDSSEPGSRRYKLPYHSS
ncbi:VIR protein [Plasmodium vivax]|uniref:VIR protein n=1 Tax=Plasmodium vivax TaxID=5855 RepID=A0A1G4E6Q2_PLAVI|nr:VIR protein [Plasmodium vivax]